ncbi:hypothetical protein CYMTET_29721, partial [Cymbomonas tetramitiformis]
MVCRNVAQQALAARLDRPIFVANGGKRRGEVDAGMPLISWDRIRKRSPPCIRYQHPITPRQSGQQEPAILVRDASPWSDPHPEEDGGEEGDGAERANLEGIQGVRLMLEKEHAHGGSSTSLATAQSVDEVLAKLLRGLSVDGTLDGKPTDMRGEHIQQLIRIFELMRNMHNRPLELSEQLEKRQWSQMGKQGSPIMSFRGLSGSMLDEAESSPSRPHLFPYFKCCHSTRREGFAGPSGEAWRLGSAPPSLVVRTSFRRPQVWQALSRALRIGIGARLQVSRRHRRSAQVSGGSITVRAASAVSGGSTRAAASRFPHGGTGAPPPGFPGGTGARPPGFPGGTGARSRFPRAPARGLQVSWRTRRALQVSLAAPARAEVSLAAPRAASRFPWRHFLMRGLQVSPGGTRRAPPGFLGGTGACSVFPPGGSLSCARARLPGGTGAPPGSLAAPGARLQVSLAVPGRPPPGFPGGTGAWPPGFPGGTGARSRFPWRHRRPARLRRTGAWPPGFPGGTGARSRFPLRHRSTGLQVSWRHRARWEAPPAALRPPLLPWRHRRALQASRRAPARAPGFPGGTGARARFPWRYRAWPPGFPGGTGARLEASWRHRP